MSNPYDDMLKRMQKLTDELNELTDELIDKLNELNRANRFRVAANFFFIGLFVMTGCVIASLFVFNERLITIFLLLGFILCGYFSTTLMKKSTKILDAIRMRQSIRRHALTNAKINR